MKKKILKIRILSKRHKHFYVSVLFSIMALSACGTQNEFIYEPDSDEGTISASANETVFTISEIEDNESIYVYVGGHVKNKGIYVLDKGSRVCDAINAAGGTDRDLDSLNLNPAAVLSDGEKLIVMEKEEITGAARDESGGPIENSLGSSGLHNNIININTAPSEVLKTIPGIGEVRAKAIINYRETKGQFKTAKDITKVSGIKEGTFEKIKDYITVD